MSLKLTLAFALISSSCYVDEMIGVLQERYSFHAIFFDECKSTTGTQQADMLDRSSDEEVAIVVRKLRNIKTIQMAES